MGKIVTMEKTLYVTDLDGTLINSTLKAVSMNTVTMLNRAIAAGALFTVATARTPATAVSIMSEVKMNLPMIVLSGAAMWDNARRCYEHVQVIDEALVEQLCVLFARHGLNPFIYRLRGGIIHVSHRGAMHEAERSFVSQRRFTPYKVFHLDDPHYATAPGRAMLVFAMNDYARLEPLFTSVKTHTPCHVSLYHDNLDPAMGLLEIYAPLTTKAAAIARLAGALGVSRTVVFGDNLNDISMLQAATVGVAVANAFEPVKAAATRVIGECNDDAVARFILHDFNG